MKFLLTAVLLSLGFSIQSAAQAVNHLHLYGSVGVKWLATKTFAYTHNISPATATIIGGGGLWQKKKIQLGGEFFYANGIGHHNGFRSAHDGVHASILVAYPVDLGNRYQLSLQSGVGYSLDHLYLTDQQATSPDHLNTAIFHHFGYSIPVAVMLQRVSKRGTFIGFKAGYQVPVSSNHWKYREGAHTHHYNTTPDGVYLQLILGGSLKFQ